MLLNFQNIIHLFQEIILHLIIYFINNCEKLVDIIKLEDPHTIFVILGIIILSFIHLNLNFVK